MSQRREKIEKSIEKLLGSERLTAYKLTEQKLKDYYSGKLKNDIEKRKEYKRYPPSIPNDVHIKAQGGMSNPIESDYIRIHEDMIVVRLERRYRTIEKFLESLDVNDQIILKGRYKQSKMWKNICKDVNYSERHCRRINQELISSLANWLSWE